MPGLQHGLVRAAHEPLRQVRVGDDVAAAGERLVPGGAVQHDRPRGRRRRGLAVPDHPQVLQAVRGAAAQQLLVDGARRVPVRPPVEGAVEHRLAARQPAGARMVALAQRPLPVRAALRLWHGGPGVEEQPVVEAPVDGEGLAARLRRHRQRLEHPGRDPHRRFRAGAVAQVQVPAAGGQRDGAGEDSSVPGRRVAVKRRPSCGPGPAASSGTDGSGGIALDGGGKPGRRPGTPSAWTGTACSTRCVPCRSTSSAGPGAEPGARRPATTRAPSAVQPMASATGCGVRSRSTSFPDAFASTSSRRGVPPSRGSVPRS